MIVLNLNYLVFSLINNYNLLNLGVVYKFII